MAPAPASPRPAAALLWLARATPALDPAFAQSAIEHLSSSERARLAAITRPTRRAEFIAGHRLLREALRAWWHARAADDRMPSIEVAADGRPQCEPVAGLSCGLSLAHSGGWVAALVCDDALPGVDIELSREPGDAVADDGWPLRRPPRAMTADALDRWVAAEARIKSSRRDASAWVSRWAYASSGTPGQPAPRLHVAVAMSCIPPAVQLVNLERASYNSREIALAWSPATQ